MIYEQHLDKNAANYTALSPLSFLRRAATLFPDKKAVVHGQRDYSYAEFYARCRRFASSLTQWGVEKGDTVAIMAANIPAMLEAHYAVPMVGAVINAINYRLDADNVRFVLEHGEAKVFLVDREFSATAKEAIAGLEREILVIDIDDPEYDGPGERLSFTEYELFLSEGDPEFSWELPSDEWNAIALNYTSGTTGNPKGVVFHHRGAYLNALGNLMSFSLDYNSAYLWTLPMFHCNGWTFTWAVTAACGTHVCLRRVDPQLIFPAIKEQAVTHMCGAPIVLNMLSHAPEEQKVSFPQTVKCATGGAAPPSAVIETMNSMGFDVLHLYGLTESYGPATLCTWKPEWDDLDATQRAEIMARQGVHYVTSEDAIVAKEGSTNEAPWDGETIGEILLKGNTVMRGYLKNPEATDAAFEGGWYHSGDLAVRHPDGYIEIKDRAKDIIITGGENVSSLEIEETLYRHPKVMDAAVVAKPDPHWGETPCAFITLKEGMAADEEEIIDYCTGLMARFKRPKTVVFGPLPKTSTGKIQKFVLRDKAKEL